eukprot:CAMPEP_0168257434 /NCGR_PEP_ID=MMETSP0141_2-20121125/6506_1 /TAXON_ID=44445 /ORGANISM="Pseudo-nitzschia australis, Strain 10249 10 AB" /LENGTH=292 /DNA_ID=CAMNT_0008194441 /DNA_START=55 /DNA_END=933 /DNA_ORIENTATION=-
MDLDTSRIPFGGLIENIRNDANNDDDFDPVYSYGNFAQEEDDIRIGLELVLILLVFLFAMVAVRYGCIFFIDAVILCQFRCNRVRNSNGGNIDGNGTETHANDRNNNTTTDHNNDTDDSDSSSVDLEMANCDSGTKNLLVGLTLAEKRNIFSSVLKCRNATESDIRGCLKQVNNNKNSSSNNNINSTNGSNINSTNGSKVDPDSVDTDNNNNNDVPVAVPVAEVVPCCPICIQDINVGDEVGHSELCRHLFHLDCIVDWLSTGSTLCPCCRRVILTKVELEERLQRQRQSSK